MGNWCTSREFLKAVLGFEPFNHQVTVADMLANGQYRDCLDLPPSTGKTAIVPAWYYALAHQLRTGDRTIPLRKGLNNKALAAFFSLLDPSQAVE